MPEPKWRRFEKLVYEIQKNLAGNATITLDDSVPGVDSGRDRQIDISIRQTAGPHNIFIVVECKDRQQRLDVNVVGEFCTVVKDVRANKGAIVSASGFSEAALNLAKQHGIDTFRLVDTESVDWRVYVAVPVVLQRTGFGSVQAQALEHHECPA